MNRRALLKALAYGGFAATFSAPFGCRPSGTTPVDPVWGKQACAHCAMHVSDRECAAQIVTASGDRLHFDDLGCLVAYVHERTPRVLHAWVRAPAGAAAPGGWVDAYTTKYRSGATTPMDYGFVATAGEGLSFAEVERRAQARLAGDDEEVRP